MLAEERAIESARWCLSTVYGGKYKFDGKLPQFVILSVYKMLVRSKNKKLSETISTLAILLSKYHGIDYPTMLFNIKNNIPCMNKAPKHKIRQAFRECFNTLIHSDVGSGASSWYLSTQQQQGSTCFNVLVKSHDNQTTRNIDHLIFDMPMWMRKISNKANSCKNMEEVILMIIKSVADESIKKGIGTVTLCEDVGGCLQKMVTELMRDNMKKSNTDTSKIIKLVSYDQTLPKDKESNWLGKGYSQRGEGEFRDMLRRIIFDFVQHHPEKVAKVMGNEGTIQFAGYGENDDQRMSTFQIVCSSHNPKLEEVAELKSNCLEDTNQVAIAKKSLNEGKNVVIVVEDGDLPQIGVLNVGTALMESEDENLIVDDTIIKGNLFIKMTQQSITIDGKTIMEEYINCNELSQSMINHSGFELANINIGERVPSVIALMILLGGDTTSYLYLPYTKCLQWYLRYTDFVGSLVRDGNENEKSNGFGKWVIDMEAVVRLMILLYALKNPKALPSWNSLPHHEQISHLKNLTYSQVQKVVAKSNLPKIFRYMPSLDNLHEHVNRAILRLHTWLYAFDRNVPDVPMLGFKVILKKEELIEKRLAPTNNEVAILINNGYKVESVEAIFHEINTTHVEMFGKNGPSAEEIVEAANNATSNAIVRSNAKLKILETARHKIDNPEHYSNKKNKNQLTAKEMETFMIIYYKEVEGLNADEMKKKRQEIGKAAIEKKTAYDKLINYLEDNNIEIPWSKMGVGDAVEDNIEADEEVTLNPNNEHVQLETNQNIDEDDDDVEDEEQGMENTMQTTRETNPEAFDEVSERVGNAGGDEDDLRSCVFDNVTDNLS